MAENEEQEILDISHTDLGNFFIRIQHRQNASLQGSIEWLEGGKTLYFRSAWEMMKLIDEALRKTSSSDDIRSWTDQQ